MTLDGTCRPMFWLNLSRIQIMWKCRFTPAEGRGQLVGRGGPAGRVERRGGGQGGERGSGWRGWGLGEQGCGGRGKGRGQRGRSKEGPGWLGAGAGAEGGGGVRRWGQGRRGCRHRRPRPVRPARAPGRCPPPRPHAGARPRRGAPLTDGLVAQHGVEEAHLHLGAPHHRLLGRAGGRFSRPLVARRAAAAHLSLPHSPAAQRRAPCGSWRGHGLRAGALHGAGARSVGSLSGSRAAPAQAQLRAGSRRSLAARSRGAAPSECGSLEGVRLGRGMETP